MRILASTCLVLGALGVVTTSAQGTFVQATSFVPNSEPASLVCLGVVAMGIAMKMRRQKAAAIQAA